MKKIQPIRLDFWPHHSWPIGEPWIGDECDEKPATVRIIDISAIGETSSWYGEYRFAIRATSPDPADPIEFLYLGTYDPRTSR